MQAQKTDGSKRENLDLRLYDVSKRRPTSHRRRGVSNDYMSSLAQPEYGKDFTMQDISENETVIH